MCWLLHYALMTPAGRRVRAGDWVLVETDCFVPWNNARRENGGPEGSCTLNPPADNGALCLLSYESKLVGSAGNAPVVASGLFDDAGFTGRQPGRFPELVAGVGVAPTEAELMRLA